MIRDKRLKHAVFDVLYYTRTLHLLRPRRSGIGIIFLMHRVVPAGTPILASDLAVQSDFLDEILGYVRRLGWDIVSIPEVHRRLLEGHAGGNFACFTFDDGYLDNLTVALPLFRKYGAPMCVYITTGMIDRKAFLWWPVLEHMLLTRDEIGHVIHGRREALPTRTFIQKMDAYWKFLPWLSGPEHSEPKLMELFECNQVDPVATMSPLILDWQQARELASDPLVEIGCHTVTHRPLADIPEAEVAREMADAREILEKKLSVQVRHLSYPYGRKPECSEREFRAAHELGFLTATTTRPGNIFPAHKQHLTALPRLNVCGGEAASLRTIREGLFGASVRLNYAQALVTD
jgi:peptidoglycan/xylan/chitin deacetylase (PgdA/CDA1 family)